MWVTFFEKGILEMKVFRPKPIHPYVTLHYHDFIFSKKIKLK